MVAVSVGALSGRGMTPGPGEARSTRNLRLARRLYVLVFIVLIVVYVAAHVARGPIFGVVSLVAAAGVTYGTVVLRPQRWGAWALVGLALLILGAADTWLYLSGNDIRSATNPVTVLYLATYVPLVGGLLALGRPRLATRDWVSMLDAAALTLAGSLVLWVLLVRPAVVDSHLTGLSKVSAIGTWVGFVGVLAACLRLLMLWRRNLSAVLLSVGVAAFLCSDFLYAHTLATGRGELSVFVDVGSLLFYALCGFAALLPTMATIATTRIGFARYDLSPSRLFILAMTMLVAPTVLLIEATPGPVTAGVAIALVSGFVGVLMLVRLSVAAAAYRRRGSAANAFRAASRSLVIATAGTEVTSSLTAALRAMLPRGCASHSSVVEHGRFDHTHDEPPASGSDVMAAQHSAAPNGTCSTLTDLGRGLGELLVQVGADALPVAGRYSVMFSAPKRYLIDLAPALESLAEQAGTALARIDLVSALQAEERERYFRTLVLTSTDATLICRNGRVDYATPSAKGMFGRDVQGEVFDALVEPTPDAPQTVSQAITPHWHPVADDAARSTSPAVIPAVDDSTVDIIDGVEGTILRPDGTVRTVRVQGRDLSRDPTVNGVVITVRDVTAERELQRSLAYRASHDPLTGLANAEVLRDQLRADRDDTGDGTMCAVLFVDLDDFKQVNDTYGHEVGDGLLVNVAYRIRAVLRADDLAARLGGDEFAALLRDVSDLDAARRTARRIADSLARPVTVGGVTIDSKASVGLAVARTPAEVDSLLRRADTALYTAKEEGKGDWREYREGMISPIRRRNDLRVELENAMRDDTLALHYQPIVELDTGRAAGFEALIRFDRTDGSSIPPQELIRIAEENGLIVPLGDWVIRRALTDMAALGPYPYVSVNVSPNQLRHTGFADTVREQLRACQVSPSRLILEVTERLVVAEDAQAWRYLDELHADGVRVAIDDYGTGCASLSYLRQSAIDVVKIDRSFVADVHAERDRALLEALVQLTHRLGLVQIAEGVEDADCRDTLLAMGCRYGQGFFYSAAMALPEAVAWSGSAGVRVS